MRRAYTVTIATLLLFPLLAGCGATIDMSALDEGPVDASTEFPSQEPVPTASLESPTQAAAPDFPIAGSITSQMKGADGYHADLSLRWSSLVRFTASEALALLPECTAQIDGFRENGATDANIYVFRAEGSLTYPVVDGFQRPAQRLMETGLYQHLESASDSLTMYTTSRSTCEGDMTPQPPAGGEFVQTVVIAVPKTPNNPEGELRPQPGGSGQADVSVEDWIRTEFEVNNGASDVDCTNALENSAINASKNTCNFLMDIPIG